MRWSIPLGRVMGIRIAIHVSFFLIVAWIAWLGWAYGGAVASVWAVGLIALLFLCVVLHELGHSAVALHYGIAVEHITLLPIGGVAGMKAMPEEPHKELFIAVAGPLVNVVILALLIPLNGFPAWIDAPIVPQTVPELVDAIIRANMILVLFNLIPAFPMDGGRILRALLAMCISYGAATAWAAGIGRVMAAVFVLVGLYVNPFLALIGVFVFLGAEGEFRMVRVKEAVKNVPVRLLMRRAGRVITVSDTLRTCLEVYHYEGQEQFVVTDEEGLCGILPASTWMEAVKEYGPDEPVQSHCVRRFVTFRPDTSLDRIIQDVWEMKQECFPVVEESDVVGVLQVDDLSRFIEKKLRPASAPSFEEGRAESDVEGNAESRYTIDLG